MKTAHLQIGSYKTGTTSMQQTLYHNRNVLNKLGYHYPGGHVNHHFSFFATQAEQKDLPRQFLSFDRKKLLDIIDHYFNSLEKGFQKDFNEQIISTEYLFITEKKYITNYINYLKQFFDDVIVYVFVRNPVEYFRSFQQQMIKARSYISSPQIFKYQFKKVIEAWQEYCEVKVLEYKKGTDSCKTLCEQIAIQYEELEEPSKNSNTSLSIEQMALLEKIQYNLYSNKEDKFKKHLGIISQIDAPFVTKSKLKIDIQKLIYKKHREDIEWLNNEYGINFINKKLENASDGLPAFKNGKATVRDVYKVPSEETVEKYEALVIDALLKKLVQDSRS